MISNGYQYVKGFLWSQIVTIENIRNQAYNVRLRYIVVFKVIICDLEQ